MGWSYTQQVVLAVIPKITAVLSFIGSGWIMIEVLTDNTDPVRPKRRHPYHRLLFAMSLYDVLEAIFNFMSTWMIPKGTPNVAWALGNTATCSTQGFFLTLSVAVPIYNAMLSIYYVLVINYRWKDETLSKWVEPTMHAVAGGWAFFTALYSASTGLINNANLWCWIAPLPSDCKDSWRYGPEGNCVRGDNAWIYRWAFYFAPLWACIFIATVCTIMVYLYVRKMDKQTIKYRRPERFSYLNTVMFTKDGQQNGQAADSAAFTTKATPICRVGMKDEEDDEDDSKIFTHGKADPTSKPTRTVTQSTINETPDGSCESDVHENKCLGRDTDNQICTSTQATVRICAPDDDEDDDDDDEGECRYGNPRGNTNKSEDSDEDDRQIERASALMQPAKSVRNMVTKWQSSRSQYRDDYKRTVEVFYQACFYLGAFYLTHIWSTSNRIMQMINQGSSAYGLTVMHSIFDPLQGFLNYFVYQRPRYLKIRKAYPEVGRIGALYRMLRFSFLPHPKSWEEKHDIYRRDHPSQRRRNSSVLSRNSNISQPFA